MEIIDNRAMGLARDLRPKDTFIYQGCLHVVVSPEPEYFDNLTDYPIACLNLESCRLNQLPKEMPIFKVDTKVIYKNVDN